MGSLVRWGPEAAKQVRSVRAMLCTLRRSIFGLRKTRVETEFEF